MTEQTRLAPIANGLEDNARANVAEGLATVLAGTYALALKTQNFHWNVTGPRFRGLHALFEEQYTDLQGASDEIAERIRSLAAVAPGGLARFAALSPVEDAPDVPPGADAMVAQLAADNDTLARTLRGLIGEAGDAGDEATADLLTGRLATHEKAAWMLRASLG
ncbi:DNA starvation/stationary phase protection protein [Roseospira marina]|uniref:DNA starvation/stationary phase protection protein n=1 Tax=Roseospira marina TaxID=140057 RepID=A0A5M6IGU2_9PROT|nr:DNA starvation/stationary phase protection protein [Roseospira marina]KAA5607444.1 DNA starvation/stationary phase protection protein [Roseospira marina]MBB4312377.1 starvation-inducible DNA-binding protein [Roseospira marina]MBB5085607.1 starvation-inducible DNA-binding protein [Roseospira marina]